MKVPTCTCGATEKIMKMLDEDKAHQFLMGLDDDLYSTVLSQILATDPLPSLDWMFNMVQQEESHKKMMCQYNINLEQVVTFVVSAASVCREKCA